MRSLRALLAFCILLAGLPGVRDAAASQWAPYAYISPTTTLAPGHLCYTDGLGIACDASAPLASGLGLSDRIVSGTSSVFVANGSAVSVTIGGSNVANFGTGGLGITAINASGLVTAAGVSTTGPISATAGYFAGNVGVGTAAPAARLHIMSSGSDGTPATLRLTTTNTGSNQYASLLFDSAGSNALDIKTGYVSSGNKITLSPGGTTTAWFLGSGRVGVGVANPLSKLDVAGGLAVGNYAGVTAAPTNGLIVSGNVGIGTTTPAATLQVSGTFIVSTTGQNTTPSLYIGTGGGIGFGTSTGTSKLDWKGLTTDKVVFDATGGTLPARTATYSFYANTAANSGAPIAMDVGFTDGAGTRRGGFLFSDIATAGDWVVPRLDLNQSYGGAPEFRSILENQTSSWVGMKFTVQSSSNTSLTTSDAFSWNNYSNELMRLSASGKLGIGTAIPTAKLEVVGTASATNMAAVSVTTGALALSGTTTASCASTADLGIIRLNGSTAEICSPYP